MRSIRSYLLSRLVGGAALVLGLAGVILYAVLSRALEEELDRGLSDAVQGMASILFQTADRVDFEFSEQLMPQYEAGPRAAYFELRFEDGRLLERSPSLVEADADLVPPEPPGPEPRHWSAPLPDGRTGRFVSQLIEIHHVFPEEGAERPRAARVSVVIGQGQEELVGARRRVLLTCAASFLALLGLIAASSWRAVERGLEPAERLASTLDAIRVEALPAALELGPMPEELEPVARKSDQLIRRVRAALERERRTTADIAHELRTPLSEVLTVSEVALRNGRDPDGSRRALGTIREVAARMGRAVATLLELARADMGSERARRESVDLGSLLAELARSVAPEVRERGLAVQCGVSAGETVEGDPEVLRIVLSNLFANAVHYADPQSTVGVALRRESSGWAVTIQNSTHELEPADLSSLTEPFWRKERARSDRSRAGLGLALSGTLAERAGLELSFSLEEGTLRARLGGRAAP